MSASGKRSPPSNAAPVPSAEDEELERIATMNDEDLDAHLVHSGVDVADLDAQVDSIREQIVSSRIGTQALSVVSASERAMAGLDDEADAQRRTLAGPGPRRRRRRRVCGQQLRRRLRHGAGPVG